MHGEAINCSHPQYHRSPLSYTLAAIARGELRLGFLGGSITAPYGETWPEGVISWFKLHYPNVRLYVENVAIGATGSLSGLFRAQRDLIDRDCDIVFVEYAVNDRAVDRELRRKTQEGVTRKLLAGGKRDLVFTYTFARDMYDAMASGEVPESVRDLDEIASHYGIGSVWMALHAFNQVKQGIMRWEEWLPDGLHPQSRGSWSYAESVNTYLQKELLEGRTGPALEVNKPPLEPLNWENARTLPFTEVQLDGPWTIRRSQNWWADQILSTAAVGAKLAFDFTGKALCLGCDFGKTSAEFRYRIDGGEWQVSKRERYPWCQNSGWFQFYRIPQELAEGPHRFELEVVHGNRDDCTGTNFGLAQIGIV